MAVIARARQDALVTHLVDTAVTDVRPVRPAFLYQAHGAGRARPEVHRDVAAQAHDLVVRPRQRPVTNVVAMVVVLVTFLPILGAYYLTRGTEAVAGHEARRGGRRVRPDGHDLAEGYKGSRWGGLIGILCKGGYLPKHEKAAGLNSLRPSVYVGIAFSAGTAIRPVISISKARHLHRTA